MTDVVEGLERQPAHQGGVADDDGDPFEAVPQVPRLRETLGDRQARPGMPAIEHVVRRLGPPREPTDAVELAQRAKAVEPTGQQLVRVGLVTRVPDDVIARRLEEPMEGDRQLHDAKRRAEMSTGVGDRSDDRVADLDSELGEVRLIEAAQVGWALDRRQDGQRNLVSWLAGASSPVWSGRRILVLGCDGSWRTGCPGTRRRAECKPVPCRSRVSAVRAGLRSV